jgi:membrane fusion protein (multidrug efflux system)
MTQTHPQDGDASPQEKPEEPEKPSPLKNPVVAWSLVIIAGVLIILGLLWFVHYWTHGRFIQGTNDAALQSDQVTVATRVQGFVDDVYVVDNQTVKAGQPLVKIDERETRAKMEQALAQVAQGRASVAQAEAQIRQQAAQIAESEAQLQSARVQARFAERQADRYAPLAASGAETTEKYDQIRENRDQSAAAVAQQAAALLAARRQIDTLKAQILAANAQIAQAEAQVGQAKVDQDATLLRASIDGRIGDKTVRVGQYVQPGARLMTVVPISRLYVVANFKETQLGLMRIGQPATITVDAMKGEALHGVVESFSPGTGGQFSLIPPNNATGNFTKIVQRVPTRIRIEAGLEARKVLVPGMSATVSVDTISAKSDAKASKREGKETKTDFPPAPAHQQDDGAGR